MICGLYCGGLLLASTCRAGMGLSDRKCAYFSSKVTAFYMMNTCLQCLKNRTKAIQFPTIMVGAGGTGTCMYLCKSPERSSWLYFIRHGLATFVGHYVLRWPPFTVQTSPLLYTGNLISQSLFSLVTRVVANRDFHCIISCTDHNPRHFHLF